MQRVAHRTHSSSFVARRSQHDTAAGESDIQGPMRWSFILALCIAGACSENSESSAAKDASAPKDASTSTDASTTDASGSEGSVEPDAISPVDAGSDASVGANCPPTGASDIGVKDPSLLKPSERIVVSQSGTVVENVDVDGDIEIVDGASNITIRNFRIHTTGYWGIFVRDGSNVVIEDGEIDGLDQIDDGIRGGSYTARRLYIHNMGGDSFKADGDNLIECNYVTAIGQAPGAHGDGIQMMGSGNIHIERNNFDLTTGELTACIFPFGTDPVTGPVYADGNRLNGGAYIVYCDPNLHMTDNVFGPDYAYGPVTGTCGTWTNNVWEATGETIPN